MPASYAILFPPLHSKSFAIGSAAWGTDVRILAFPNPCLVMRNSHAGSPIRVRMEALTFFRRGLPVGISVRKQEPPLLDGINGDPVPVFSFL